MDPVQSPFKSSVIFPLNSVYFASHSQGEILPLIYFVPQVIKMNRIVTQLERSNGNQYVSEESAVNVVITTTLSTFYSYLLAFVLFYDQEVAVLFWEYPAYLCLRYVHFYNICAPMEFMIFS